MIFIANTSRQEREAKREFSEEGLELNLVGGIPYLGAYLGPRAELEAWVKPQVEERDHGVRRLSKIAKKHPQLVHYGLGIL